MIDKRRSLTPATAMIFEAVLGIDAGLLMHTG
jgi:hypothetical protein